MPNFGLLAEKSVTLALGGFLCDSVGPGGGKVGRTAAGVVGVTWEEEKEEEEEVSGEIRVKSSLHRRSEMSAWRETHIRADSLERARAADAHEGGERRERRL